MQDNCIGQGGLLFVLQAALFIALLMTASVFDVKKRIIPDTICIGVVLTGLICFEPSRLFGCFSALPFLVAALMGGKIGGGDIKLTAATGVVLGIGGSIAAMIIGLTAMLLFYAAYAILQRLRKRERQKAFPLAPFLSIGCIAAYLINTGGITL
ncbi:prepilin peptidase [Ruminiclostridium cellulolyticum]|uniref:Peptidase A24A prepilin type IV n=1 Tax=Ruminiclostridium cellulolyticum (strain ATCC 35319 / DSM 5812 / JCM 6584 / H10) TaxID=394503 RepID=B8I7K6_RUMCH|nr:prepilin peptidase [Ruminiclostridium cellulolyticum]ACL77077.1 peptidase A24A prepilin type IV [Ruminiclostridium cellulolyticum H10]